MTREAMHHGQSASSSTRQRFLGCTDKKERVESAPNLGSDSRRMWLRLLILSACCAALSCVPAVCERSSCPNGCCSKDICYLGTGARGGVTCGFTPEVDAGATSCGRRDAACGPGRPCCATGSDGVELTCSNAVCTNITTRCSGTYNSPCNATLCCASGYVCKGERCDSCYEGGRDCSYNFERSKCCPGFECRLKPGFSTVYECI
jgi:hypothetical protein